jgi:hypothetical protein
LEGHVLIPPRPKANGHDKHAASVRDFASRKTPVDVDQRLADMRFEGGDETGIHWTQLQCTASLLRFGCPVDDVVDTVLDATRRAVAGDPRTAKWDWTGEERGIRRMCYDLINKNPELAALLPDALSGPFQAALEKGRRPRITFASHIRWHVRSHEDKTTGADSAADDTASSPGAGNTIGSPGAAPSAKPSGWKFYDSAKVEPARWLIKGILPESCVAIIPGQWGSYKTTTALYLTLSVMTEQPFAGHYRVKRPGGVLYFAPEGSGTLHARLAAIARHSDAPEKLPFAWRADCPQLSAKTAGTEIAAQCDEASSYLRRVYGVPTVLILIDTYAAAAGFSLSGDDNDKAATQKAFNALRFVHKHTGAAVVVVDHFGKTIEAGTSGSSGKEGNADAVLAALADKELTGVISNTRLAMRKQRDGASGFEIPFAPKVVELGLDEDGDPITAVVLDWGKPKRMTPQPRKSKVVLLCSILAEAAKREGFPFQPDVGGLSVQAVHASVLKAVFFDRRHVNGDTAAKRHDQKRKAWDRALETAQLAGLIGIRDIGNDQIIWPRQL